LICPSSWPVVSEQSILVLVMMNLYMVSLILCICYTYSCTAPVSDELYRKSISALITPSLCNLKLICVISQSESANLKAAHFMQGISVLASYSGNLTTSPMLRRAIRTGTSGESCSGLAPDCGHSERELLLASQALRLGEIGRKLTDRRRKKVRSRRSSSAPFSISSWVKKQQKTRHRRHTGGLSLSSFPPVFRPGQMASTDVCKTCDERSSVCTVFSIGTTVGCFVFAGVGGPGGQLACNVATAPISIGCGKNTLHCYLENCGLVSL